MLRFAFQLKYCTLDVHTKKFYSQTFNVLFFGSDYFSIGPFKKLNNLRIGKSCVGNLGLVCCSQPKYNKKAKNIFIPPVVTFANENNIPQVNWNELKQTKRLNDYDLAVVASFGEFIPSNVIDLFKFGSINIHPSLLPRWRGPAPIIHTILSGDEITGISFIKLSKKKFDTGKIIFQEQYKVPSQCSTEELTDLLSNESGKLLPHVFKNLKQLSANSITQDESMVTLAPKVSKASGFVDFSIQTCYDVERLFRALPNKIGIQCIFDGKRIKFRNIRGIQEDFVSDEYIVPGTCKFSKKDNILWIKCLKGWISIDSIQVELKRKSISAASFYNGYIIDKNNGEPSSKIFEAMSSNKE